LVGLVGQKIAVAIFNSFYVISSPHPNWMKTQKFKISAIGRNSGFKNGCSFFKLQFLPGGLQITVAGKY